MSKYNWIINGIIGFKSISSGLWLTCTWVEHLAQIGGKPFLYSKMENVYFRVKLFNTYNSKPRIWAYQGFNPAGQFTFRFD